MGVPALVRSLGLLLTVAVPLLRTLGSALTLAFADQELADDAHSSFECVDMFWAGGSVWVSGPETRSWPSAAAPGTDVVGVCFRSGVASSLLGVAASELRDVRVRLDQLWGDRAARELAERVSCRGDDDGRATELENAARQMAEGAWGLDVVALEATDRLRTARTASARELARATHLSERQLHRRCTAGL
jgi:hypothetical protein